MKIEQLNQQIIINEWQLGQQLNVAVHNNTRDKFNLLLSFLSDDVRDFAQFENSIKENEANKEVDLRHYFKLPAEKALINTGPSMHLLAELNHDLQNTNITEIHFKQLLTNEAILSKPISRLFPEELLDNLPLLKQQRVSEAYQNEEADKTTKPMGVDARLLDEYKDLALTRHPLKVHYT